MSLKENYLVKDYKSPSSKDNQLSIDVVKYLLINEHRVLLKTVEPIRILNRGILFGVALFQIIYAPLPLGRNVAFLAISALASVFWYIQELLIRRKIDGLGELIATTSAEQLAGMKADYGRSVAIRPLNESLPEPKISPEQIKQAWINAYINWRHEIWKYSKLQTAQSLEPIMWFILLLAIGVFQMLTRYSLF